MSCADVQTIQAGDGTKSEFSFDFPYLFKSEVKVYFWNRVTKEYDEIAQDGSGWGQAPANTIYPWEISDANPTIVHFTEIDSGGNTAAVPPSPAAAVDPNEETVDNVKIRRETSIDDIRALFNPGSAIRSDDLNKNFEQLRYAIQEGNCQGITDDVYEYLKDNYWDRYDNTLYEDDAWVSDDTKIATTAALDKRFQDEVAETITSSESWPDNDDTIATTAAIDNRIDTAITNDIGTDGTGITVTDDGDGTITLGLGAGSIDFDRIKDVDIITQAEQDAGSPAAADNNLFTALAAARRFDTIVQTTTPSGSDWEVGKSWLQNDADKTFSIWDGDSWEGISSGGTFINQPKVVYVDATNGNDDNDGHRISRPKASIKAAINQINADSTYGDGSIVVVAPGVYREAAPIQIQKRDVSVVGTSLRSCVVHPTQATETNTLFEVNSGTYLKNLTFTGVKASGTRGEAGSLYTDATYGLPATQGWNVAFLAGATIVKSPYIQNCTNFSDSEIDNTDLGFYDGTEDKGRAGDEDSAMTGGGLLVDGSVPAATSPLRSMVCDSYTHVGLDGPGILVTNNGYAQCTSSYAFFNHFHIACINGGQANLAASTTDFGRFSLITDGRSPNAIFTSNVDGAADDEAISFNINAPTASTDLYNEAGTENDNAWWGSATRPQPNMLVEVNGVTYPILSATPNTDSEGGAGWTVTISRPDPNNRSTNLGLNGAITDDAAVSFFLRSMIASSGHTMEYVGAGTNYSALPENGGVPNDSNQIIELNNGKVWTAITDHNGKFRIGGNQTTDPIFEVDQQLGFVTIPEGSIAFNLLSDLTPQLGGNLDVNGNTITSTSNADVVIDPNGTGTVDVSTSRITNVTDPTGAQDAATKNYVDTNSINNVVEDTTPQLGGNLDVNGQTITSASNGDILIDPDGTGIISLGSSVGIGTSSPSSRLTVVDNSSDTDGASGAFIDINNTDANSGVVSGLRFKNGGTDSYKGAIYFKDTAGDARGDLIFATNDVDSGATEVGLSDARMTITRGGNVGVGTSSPAHAVHIAGATTPELIVEDTTNNVKAVVGADNTVGRIGTDTNHDLTLRTNDTEKVRIDSSGRLLVGANSSSANIGLAVQANSGDTEGTGVLFLQRGLAHGSIGESSTVGRIGFTDNAGNEFARVAGAKDGTSGTDDYPGALVFSTTADTESSPTERMRINSDGTTRFRTNAVFLQAVSDTDNTQISLGRPNSTSAGYIRYVNSEDALAFRTGGSGEDMRIDSSGRLLVGTTSAIDTSTNSLIQIGSTVGAYMIVGRDDTSLVDGNTIGGMRFYGNDSDGNYEECARIQVQAAGTHRSDSKPTRLMFWTTGDGLDSPTERMRITSAGQVGIGKTSSFAYQLEVEAGNTSLLRLNNNTETGHGSHDVRIVAGGIYYQNIEFRASSVQFSTYDGSTISEGARIDSSGRLLVGTSSWSTDHGVVVAKSGSNSGGSLFVGKYDSSINSGDFAGQVAFGSSYDGNIGALIKSEADATWTHGSSHPGRLVFSTTADGASSPTERMRITQAGYLNVSTNISDSARYNSGSYHVIHSDAENAIALTVENSATSPYGMLIDFSDADPDNNTNYFLKCLGGASTNRLFIYSDGDVQNHDNSYGAISDEKLKQDIVDAGSQWDDLKNLRVRKFKFKSDVEAYGDEAKTLIGVVAQEVETVSPGLVKNNPDKDAQNNDLGTTTKSVNYSVLYMKAVKALQEAMERIETLEAKVAALEAN